MVSAIESTVTFWDGSHRSLDSPERLIPFGSSSVQHGTAVFEGIRCYSTSTGPALFRLEEHLTRLLESARLIGIRHDYDLERLRSAVLRATVASRLSDCYVRPGLFATAPELSIDLGRVEFTLGVEVWPIAPDAHTDASKPEGTQLTISAWDRPLPSSFPSRAKAVGTYVTSALAKTSAVDAGYDDAIQLDPLSGRVAEATVSNIFLVRDGVVRTPWLSDSILEGITRDSVLALTGELGIPTCEEPVEVADLWSADEVFLTGTASELVPVSSIDDHHYPANSPVFQAISEAYEGAATGKDFDWLNWLTPVPADTVATAR
ncbi:branched chain amino acid aminotransferase apoenzyme [Actinopolyspora lacussalsi subsp. righensis]|uniref:Branched chain amino acid aminotransferase apoenzyme n=2 Tax=Actinopolyspora righensis TaxID=995060 RepID=A0A1I7CFY2_9ACTN|nr:branched chain amino acid aminotransferase apoenzyme [Actinopolyspora righensis]